MTAGASGSPPGVVAKGRKSPASAPPAAVSCPANVISASASVNLASSALLLASPFD